jgi:hypothetical protein
MRQDLQDLRIREGAANKGRGWRLGSPTGNVRFGLIYPKHEFFVPNMAVLYKTDELV